MTPPVASDTMRYMISISDSGSASKMKIENSEQVAGNGGIDRERMCPMTPLTVSRTGLAWCDRTLSHAMQ
jgi:hypothetical protein